MTITQGPDLNPTKSNMLNELDIAINVQEHILYVQLAEYRSQLSGDMRGLKLAYGECFSAMMKPTFDKVKKVLSDVAKEDNSLLVLVGLLKELKKMSGMLQVLLKCLEQRSDELIGRGEAIERNVCIRCHLTSKRSGLCSFCNSEMIRGIRYKESS
jgi:hypothetical protein